MKPEKVISPKSRLSFVKTLYECESFSIASILWDKKSCIGIRWNGQENELGYPQTHGKPTWFILPKAVALAFSESINNIEMTRIIHLTTDEVL